VNKKIDNAYCQLFNIWKFVAMNTHTWWYYTDHTEQSNNPHTPQFAFSCQTVRISACKIFTDAKTIFTCIYTFFS